MLFVNLEVKYMTDIRLKVFQSVARNLSFTAASKELFMSQPAVSRHVQELEKEYHTRLFDRMGQRIMLTLSGQLLLDYCNRILDNYRQMDFEMNKERSRFSGEIRLGASTTLAQYVMPEYIARFLKEYPHIKISMLSGNTRDIESALLKSNIDIGMVEGAARQPQIRYIPFMKDELVAFANVKGKYRSLESLSVKELQKIPLVMREQGSGTLEVIERALHGCGASLSDMNIVMYFGTTEGIKHFVAHSDAMGIVSVHAVRSELLAGLFHIVELPDLQLMRDFAFTEKHGDNSGILQTLKDFMLRT